MDGEAEAGGAGAVGAWVKQFDPNHGRHYYWNSETDEVSWDEPADFVEGTTDARVDAITKIQAVFRGGASRAVLAKHHWHKAFDPSSGMFYYWDSISGETVWEQPDDFVELALPAEWRALMVIQRASRKHLAKLRVAHMRREREKRRQREHRERMQNNGEVLNALKRADETAAASRNRRASGDAPQLRYLAQTENEEKQSDDAIANDPSITDWKEMRDMHGNYFYFSPATGKTTKVAPSAFTEVQAGPTAMEMLQLNEDETDGQEDPLGWHMHDHSAHAKQLIRDLDTHDWMSREWEPPSVAAAIEHRHEMVFHGGNASIWHTGHYQLAAKLGDGISLYFRLLSYLGWLFLMMMVFALPSLIFNVSGSRITEEEVDPIGLAYTTIGNLGYSDADIAAGLNCPRIVNDCNNQSYALFFGQPVSMSDAGFYTAVLDIGNCIVFWIFLVFFRFRVAALVAQHKAHHITATNYAVNVKGLPHDATEDEIRDFFSNLYTLSKLDWSSQGYCCGLCGAKKPRNAVLREHAIDLNDRGEIDPITGKFKPNFHQNEMDHIRVRRWNAEPVYDTANTGNRKYLDSWVAEVSVVHPNGDAIRRYLKLKSLQLKILNQKQVFLKHKHDTLDLDDKVRKKAEKKSAASLAKVEMLQRKMKSVTAGMDHSLHSQDCIGAFVLFNEEESMFRCLADYHKFSGIRRMCMPRQMRFRGKYRLRVEKATEPSAIVWQNLDTPMWNKCCRRMLSLLAMIFLLALSLFMMFAASAAKSSASKNLPDFTLCNSMPDVAYSPWGAAPSATSMLRVRTLDAECGDGKFFLSYDPAPGGVSYRDSLSVDYSSQPCANPCIDPNDATTCATNAELSHNTRVGCYCKATLAEKISEYGVFSGLQELEETEMDVCGPFLADFTMTNVLVIVSALVVVAINAVLRYLLKAISRFERHDTLSAESKSETMKIFVAMFINTGIIVLLVNADAPDLVVIPGLGLFEGDYDDFSPRWYAAVGAPVVLTMLLNVVSPHIMPLFKWLVVQPIRTYFARKTASSQELLNSVYEGPNFSIATRYPIAMNTLFVCMMFSSAMPILYLIGAMSFWSTYWIDKISLLRLYNRPPRYDESLALVATELMPLALLLHILVAIWSFGNGITLESTKLGDSVSSAIDAETDSVAFADRLTRTTTIGLGLLLLAVLVWWGSISFAKNVANWVIMVCTCGRGIADTSESKKRTVEIRPPYTQSFREVLTPYEVAALDMRSEAMTEKDKEMLNPNQYKKHGGRWIVEPERDGTRVRWRVWVNSGKKNGVRHTRGQKLRTWEVIRENALHSYKIMKNKNYRRALAAMMADEPSNFNLLLAKKSPADEDDSVPPPPQLATVAEGNEPPQAQGLGERKTAEGGADMTGLVSPGVADTDEELLLQAARSELVLAEDTDHKPGATYHQMRHPSHHISESALFSAPSTSSRSNKVAPSVVVEVESKAGFTEPATGGSPPSHVNPVAASSPPPASAPSGAGASVSPLSQDGETSAVGGKDAGSATAAVDSVGSGADKANDDGTGASSGDASAQPPQPRPSLDSAASGGQERAPPPRRPSQPQRPQRAKPQRPAKPKAAPADIV